MEILLQPKQKVSELTNEPVRVDFTFKQKDAWYESDVTEHCLGLQG